MFLWHHVAGLPLALRWAIVFWVVLIVGILGRVAASKPTKNSVVPIYLLGGERWRAAEPLYDPSPGGLDVYRNPPAVAVLFAPLSILPAKAAAILWRVFTFTLYLSGLAAVRRTLLPSDLAPQVEARFWVLAGLLAIPAMDNGQINLAIVASVLHGCAALARAGSRTAAGAWFALALWWKIYPAAALGLALLTRPTARLLAGASVALLLGFGLSWATQPHAYVWQQQLYFWETMRADDRTAAGLERAPKDWTILARLYLNQTITRPTPLLVSLLTGSLLALAAFTFARRQPNEVAAIFVLNASLFWMVLFGPATEPNTYALLAPVCAYLAVADQSRANLFVLLGTGGLVLAILSGVAPQGKWLLERGIQPAAALVLASGWILSLRR